MDKYQEMKEGLAKKLYETVRNMFTDPVYWGFKDWEDTPEDAKEAWLEDVDSLLSYRSPSGLRLALVDDKAELPENKYPDTARPPIVIYDHERNEQARMDLHRTIARTAYEEAQQDMLKAGYVKEVEEATNGTN